MTSFKNDSIHWNKVICLKIQLQTRLLDFKFSETFKFNLTKIDNKSHRRHYFSAEDENVLDLFIAHNLRPVLNKGGGPDV